MREETGVNFSKEHFDVEAKHVLDPILLFWMRPITWNFAMIYLGKHLLCLLTSLIKAKKNKKQIMDFAKRKGLPYFIKSADGATSQDDTIELWLSYFRDAAFVITDSFHGTAFAINFYKDFYVFGNADRGNSRFDSLLGLLGLKDRVITSQVAISNMPICWDRVNDLRKKEVAFSRAWLKRMLG